MIYISKTDQQIVPIFFFLKKKNHRHKHLVCAILKLLMREMQPASQMLKTEIREFPDDFSCMVNSILNFSTKRITSHGAH